MDRKRGKIPRNAEVDWDLYDGWHHQNDQHNTFDLGEEAISPRTGAVSRRSYDYIDVVPSIEDYEPLGPRSLGGMGTSYIYHDVVPSMGRYELMSPPTPSSSRRRHQHYPDTTSSNRNYRPNLEPELSERERQAEWKREEELHTYLALDRGLYHHDEEEGYSMQSKYSRRNSDHHSRHVQGSEPGRHTQTSEPPYSTRSKHSRKYREYEPEHLERNSRDPRDRYEEPRTPSHSRHCRHHRVKQPGHSTSSGSRVVNPRNYLSEYPREPCGHHIHQESERGDHGWSARHVRGRKASTGYGPEQDERYYR